MWVKVVTSIAIERTQPKRPFHSAVNWREEALAESQLLVL